MLEELRLHYLCLLLPHNGNGNTVYISINEIFSNLNKLNLNKIFVYSTSGKFKDLKLKKYFCDVCTY